MKHFSLSLIGFVALSASTAMSAQTLRSDVSLSDPAIFADEASHMYYMTGTGGGVWSSPDLEYWTGPEYPITGNKDHWISEKPGVWAPEIYKRGNYYYMLPTLINRNIIIDSSNHVRRAVHVLRSDKPSGPYTIIPGGDETYTPANKSTLDGSLFEDKDGNIYLIYCHEWIQNQNGTIEYIKLKDDMSGTIGEGHIMSRAKDGKFNTGAVTDGPFIFYTATGKLGMLWTSWRNDIYVECVAYSQSGTLDGPWIHEPMPIAPDQHGHGMLFRTFDGKLLLSIHSNFNIDYANQVFRRIPQLFVMDDSGDKLVNVMQYKPVYSLTSSAAVTVDNPGFDYGTNGWINDTDATNRKIASNKTGAITGNFFESWAENSFTGEIYQSKNLPNGTYKVRMAAFRSRPITGGNENAETVKVFANGETEIVNEVDAKYYEMAVYVTDGKLRFGIRSEAPNFQWMGIDNVSVTYYGPEKYTLEQIDAVENVDTRVYLRNKGNGMYLNPGASWGTQAVFGKHPFDVCFVDCGDNKKAIDTALANGISNHYAGSNGYLDSAITPFIITEFDNNEIAISHDGLNYWGSDGKTKVAINLTDPDDAAARWEMRKFDDLMSEMEQGTEAEPKDATFLIQCPGFGRNDTRIDAWTGKYTRAGGEEDYMAQLPEEKFNFSQTIADIPNGFYRLRVQGYTRAFKGDVVLFANSDQKPLIAAEDMPEGQKLPAGASSARTAFDKGQFINSMVTEVKNNTLKIGAKSVTGAQFSTGRWTMLDNFELEYLGNEYNGSSIESVCDDQLTTPQEGIYDIMGRVYNTTDNLAPGIYIINGKKVILTK